MKRTILSIVLFGVLTASCHAQEHIAEVVEQLIKTYPRAQHRIEYRYEQEDSHIVRQETRYDFREMRDAMSASDVDLLLRSYEKAWDSANPAVDKCVKYAYKDTICSTIVYHPDKPLNSELMNHLNISAFWGGNNGYLLFDAKGECFSVVTNRTMRNEGEAGVADFSPIVQAFKEICCGHEVDSVRVRYTGKHGSFRFHRGEGKGWTTGTRYTIRKGTEADYLTLQEAFMSFMGSKKAVNLIKYNHSVMIKDEVGKRFLIASLNRLNPDGCVNFMCATFEDEICIPANWVFTDFFNDGVTQHTDVSRLDSIYDALANRSGVSKTEVKYTGSFNGECSGFTWQRGWGKGWTKGVRIGVGHIGEEESEHIRSVFQSYEDMLGRVIVTPDMVATYEEGTCTFYGFATDKEGRAYFVKAATEGEICIPKDWTTRNYFKGSEEPVANKADDKTKRLLGLSRLWAGVRQNFVFMDRMTADWDSLYVVLIPRMEAAQSNREAVLLLKYMIAQVRDGHTYVAGEEGIPFPLTTKLIGNKVYVDYVFSSALTGQGVKRGIELTAIDHMPVADYAQKYIEPYVASSTPQWTKHVTFEGFGLTRRGYGENITLSFRDGKRDFDINGTVEKVGGQAWDLKREEDIMQFSKLKGNIGYLKISSFNDSKLTEEFDSCYSDLLRTRALIIDLRGNGGGNSGNADYILRHLSADSIKTASWRSPQHIPAFTSWGYKDAWYEQPSGYMQPVENKKIYDKPVVVLIDNGTFSAAEDFCGVFVSMKRGILIGQPTGGSTGNGVRIPLIPETMTWANICSKHDTAPDGTEFVGKGFMPDIPVEEDYQSYFIDKTDKCVTTALRMLSR
ncbi:MAG: S41 family peptidase [Prevotellaceae bacterium]|nr:S41 family peptidase [Prevotellaceae bacterium]